MTPRKRNLSKAALQARADAELLASQKHRGHKCVKSKAAEASNKATSKKQKRSASNAVAPVVVVVEEAQPDDAVLISDDDPASEAGGQDDDLEADADDDDDDVAELMVPDDPLRFTMTWKVIAGKIEMPSSRFSISKASKLSYDDLLEWGSNSEICYLMMYSDYELTFNVLEAVVTH
jgi:hypothetical protein